MNPIQSKSTRSGSPLRFPAAFAASLSRACTRLPALAALWLLAIPGVSRASSTIGNFTLSGNNVNWTSSSVYSGGVFQDTGGDGLITVTGQLYMREGSVLNQSGGTISALNPTWETIIGHFTGSGGFYNMSGTASFVATVKAVWMGNSGTGTWTLTDNANASIAALDFSHGSGYVLLSGAATFSATDLIGLAGANAYISFATDSTATFTVANKSLSDYQAYVTAGKIRVDGVAQSDFSKFQVVGHTLSLSTGGPTPPHLAITSVSPASPTAGSTFSVTVQAQNASNTATNLTEATLVTLALKTGTGTLGGIVSDTIAANSSSVTISGVTYTKAESGVVLTPGGGGLAALDSAPFTVIPGAPFQLVFTTQPGEGVPGVALDTQPAVTVRDANSNTADSSAPVTLAITAETPTSGGPGTLSGTKTVSAVNGVATFSGLSIDTVGAGYRLTATSAGLASADSSPFGISVPLDSTIANWLVTATTQTWTSTSWYNGAFHNTGGNGNITVMGAGSQLYMNSVGTLNLSGGTITVNPAWETIIGHFTGLGTYNMSGAARYVATVKDTWLGNSSPGTWTLTDHANASIAALDFSHANGNAQHLLLSGAATFSATDLIGLSGANAYISFATGSTATLTVASKLWADYQAYVTAGNIRIDGVVQTDFSKFQVVGNTLSLGTGAGADYNAWVALYPGFTDTDPTHDPDGDGMSNQQEYAFGLDPTKGSSVNPVTPLIGTQFSYTRRVTSGLAYTVEYSTDLSGWGPAAWTDDGGGAVDANGVQTVTVTVTNEPFNGKLFVRVRAE